MDLFKKLREDPELYRVYKDNIAMAFKDEVSRCMKKKYETNKSPYFSRTDSHECANQAADNFLQLLIK